MNRCRADLGGHCIHPMQGGPTTPERCASCRHYIGPPRGMGDIVHMVAAATGVAAAVQAVNPDCRCAQRRAALNAAVPFADKADRI